MHHPQLILSTFHSLSLGLTFLLLLKLSSYYTEVTFSSAVVLILSTLESRNSVSPLMSTEAFSKSIFNEWVNRYLIKTESRANVVVISSGSPATFQILAPRLTSFYEQVSYLNSLCFTFLTGKWMLHGLLAQSTDARATEGSQQNAWCFITAQMTVNCYYKGGKLSRITVNSIFILLSQKLAQSLILEYK